MPCDDLNEQLSLYLDGELAPPEAHEVAQHLRTCAACQQEAVRHHRLQALLRTTLAAEEVPTQLWPAIQDRLTRETAGAGQPAERRRQWPRWARLGAVAAVLVVGLIAHLWMLAPKTSVVQEMVNSQIRTRLTATPYRALAANPRAIRQWFQDKVEFAVPVPEFPQDRFTFLGARVTYFLDRRVAELAYTTEAHTIALLMLLQHSLDLTAIPTVRAGPRTFYVQQHKGYTAVLWLDGDILCGLVSELPQKTLVAIARQVTGQALPS